MLYYLIIDFMFFFFFFSLFIFLFHAVFVLRLWAMYAECLNKYMFCSVLITCNANTTPVVYANRQIPGMLLYILMDASMVVTWSHMTRYFSTCMLPKFNLPIMELYSYLIYLFKANSDLLESKLHVYLFHPIKYVTHHLQMRSHRLFWDAFH